MPGGHPRREKVRKRGNGAANLLARPAGDEGEVGNVWGTGEALMRHEGLGES